MRSALLFGRMLSVWGHLAAMSKEEKYDRQLRYVCVLTYSTASINRLYSGRMWGDHGQRSLEDAKVCLIGASVAGLETLKNLVLPGIGSFVIVDDALIGEDDCQKSFLCMPDDVGSSKAEVCTRYLCELNEDVSGSAMHANIDTLVDSEENCTKNFGGYSIIIVGNVPFKQLKALPSVCHAARIPLFLLQTNGLVGVMQPLLNNHFILEGRPDNSVADWRLGNPWGELEQLAASIEPMNDCHDIPWMLLLLHGLPRWCASSGCCRADLHQIEMRKAFKTFLLARWAETADKTVLEERMEEVYHNMYRVTEPVSIPSGIASLMSNCQRLWTSLNQRPEDVSSQIFVGSLQCVAAFVEAHDGVLPFSGALPDMEASSQLFLSLQQCFHAKAQADAHWLLQYHNAQVTSQGSRPIAPIMATLGHWEQWTKNTRTAAVLTTPFPPPLEQSPLIWQPTVSQYLAEVGPGNFWSSSQASLAWLLLYQAAEDYRRKHGEVSLFPRRREAEAPEEIEIDEAIVTELQSLLMTRLEACGGADICASSAEWMELCRSWVQWGGAEIHGIGALLGGVAAQEVLKVLTHQWIPLRDLFLLDGASSLLSRSLILQLA
jgi:NEDD8-activating enzyme E1 regulatory subunit